MIERDSTALKVALFRIGIEQLCTETSPHYDHWINKCESVFRVTEDQTHTAKGELGSKDGNSMLLLLCDSFTANTQGDATSLLSLDR
jgi:hypothetical protein